MSVYALEPIVLDPLELGESARAGAVWALAPHVLEDLHIAPAQALVEVSAGAPVVLGRLHTLEPVPVYVATDVGGNIWWGGYGRPPDPLVGSSPGDFYIDFDTGDVYRLVADDYGEVA